MLPVMPVIQERESISHRTKARTTKQSTAVTKKNAIKAQNCFYFKSKSQLTKRKKYQNTTKNKDEGGEIRTRKSPKSTRDTHQTCATSEHSKLKLERVSVVSWFSESCMTRANGVGVSPLSSNDGSTLISRITAQKENRDIY